MASGNLIFSLFATVISTAGGEKGGELLEQFHKNDPEACESFIKNTYPVVDVELENLAAKTKTKVDDVFVSALKKAFESAAANLGIEIENKDAD